MKHIYLYLTLIISVSISSSVKGQADFNTSIESVEQAIKNKDIVNAKNILSAEPLQSNQGNKKVQALNLKLNCLEKLLDGIDFFKVQKWDDAILSAEQGLTIVKSNQAIFQGNEKKDLEKLIADANSEKKKINLNSQNQSPDSSISQNQPNRLEDLGDPTDYKTAITQINLTHQNDINAPNRDFEARKDTMNRESSKRKQLIASDVNLNLKIIDSAQVKMDNEKERVIKLIDSYRREYENERDIFLDSKKDQTNEIVQYIRISNEKMDSSIVLMDQTNVERIRKINQNIDTVLDQNSSAKYEIQQENEKRIETIGKNQKNDDSLRYVVRTSMNEMTDENAKYVAENIKKNDEYRQAPPPVTKGTGIANSKGVPYPVGITQGVFSKGEVGKPLVLITRRVKVDENNNYDIYVKQESPNSLTSYTKNGTIVTEYQWNVESGNVTNFE